MKRLLDYDRFTGIKTYHEYDEASDKTVISTERDIQGIIDRNKRLANCPEYKRGGIKNDNYHFATVPNEVLHEWLVKYNVDWTKKEDLPKIEKLLNSRDYCHLRTVDRI